MNPEWTALAVAALALGGEWLHARRWRRVARLAFGPSGTARGWTKMAPAVRVVAVTLLAWGLVQLWILAPRASRPKQVPEGGYRHFVIALDVSPSMQLKDAGPARNQTRARRAAEVVLSVLERSALEQMRVSVVAFYTGAKPVVVDTFDLEVVKNILNDLPLEMAFEVGKTSLIDGIKESAALAKPWQPDSTTLLVVSDGDTVPDTGLPALPRSIRQVLVIGVGSARAGQNIDGHLSRQDASTLRQLATRLRGAYVDVNEKHLPSGQLDALAKALPMRDEAGKGRREWALAAVALGAGLLAALPVALALGGTSWQPGVRHSTARREREPQPLNS
ncbi:MAG: Ca-activated chloride channel [Chthoniobacter sp.]|jgi:Ca-activated chloride channel family protein|nr:Ca-activated chloride channel [Chthoniobacter sp.]